MQLKSAEYKTFSKLWAHQVKSLEWVQQRKALEAKQPPGVDDTVMCDAAGGISEGLQTNFAVLQEGAVVIRTVFMTLAGW